MRSFLLTSLIAITLIGIVAADYSINHGLLLNIDQSTKGDGYFMSYKSFRMPNSMESSEETSNGVEAMDYAHGSGRMDSKSLVLAESSNKTEAGAEDAAIMDYREALSSIQMTEDSKMTYLPITIGIGSGFYAVHPVEFDSLLKEKTWIKNRGGASSIENQIEYAHALDKQLEFKVRDFVSEEDPSTTMMNVSQSLTNGKAHIGVLQGDPDALEENIAYPSAEEPESLEVETIAFAKSAWKKPLVYVDEDYFGTLHMEKRMNLTSIMENSTEEDHWLPCCSGGFADMNMMDKKDSSANGVFDCSCFKVPERAQFTG